MQKSIYFDPELEKKVKDKAKEKGKSFSRFLMEIIKKYFEPAKK
jgi:predicted DNA-binding protein